LHRTRRRNGPVDPEEKAWINGLIRVGTQMFLVAHDSLELARYRYRGQRNAEETNSSVYLVDQVFARAGEELKTTKQRSRGVRTIFVGRWSVEILFSLKEKPYRHGQLRRRLGDISQRMLTRTLRNLESTRLVARSVTGPNGSAVEYSLTKLGRRFMVPLSSMCRWAKQERKEISADVRLLDAPGTQ
jgi:DNA-binding HxlR family transcriptional regulator